MDASDKIRKLQNIYAYKGYAAAQHAIQPNTNFSTICGFDNSIHRYTDYLQKVQVYEGLKTCSTCVAQVNGSGCQ
jgi:hypothetical protein